MDGREFARIIEQELAARGIKKGDFYSQVGVTATAMYGWKRGAVPSAETIAAVEDFFGISFTNAPTVSGDPETDELLQAIRERQDLRILLRSGKDLPVSSVYEIISKMEKMKENAN